MSRPDVHLTITSDPRFLALVRRTCEWAAGQVGFEPKQIREIVLALDEAVSNVIKYGYKKQPGHVIGVTFSMPDDTLRVKVEYDGEPLPEEGPKGRDLDDVKPGGLGSHFISTCMDEVRYENLEEGGSRITLTRCCKESPS